MQHNNHYSRPSLMVVCLFFLLASSAAAQPHYSQVLNYAEKHNPILLAASKRAEADKAAAHVGTLLPNPEIGAAYYWGEPSEIGIRWDIHASQSFEMPSVWVRRARLRNIQEHAAELNYQIVRKNLLYELQQMCADWVYYHAITEIYAQRGATAIRLAQLYQKRFDAGDCSVIEYNRAQMHLSDMNNRAADAALNEDHAIHDIIMLAGDDYFPRFAAEYEPVVVEDNFASWYEQLEMRNPEFQLLDNQAEESNQQLQLSRAQWLPTMSVGYASENRTGEIFRGVTVGLELPLWSQQRSVRAARLKAEATQQELSAQREQLQNHLRCSFHRHATLRQNLYNLKDALHQYGNQDYLERALEAGEIGLEQYLQETDFYLNMELQIWETAHELEQLHLYLYSVEL